MKVSIFLINICNCIIIGTKVDNQITYDIASSNNCNVSMLITLIGNVGNEQISGYVVKSK